MMKKIKKWSNWVRWAVDIVIVVLGVGVIVNLSISVRKYYPGYWWVGIVVPVILVAVFAFFFLTAFLKKGTDK